jgi:hypothetical protein
MENFDLSKTSQDVSDAEKVDDYMEDERLDPVERKRLGSR